MIITTIGSFADRQLKQEQSAAVMGITSQGVFLRLSSGWVIFVTDQPECGPLTINCSRSLEELDVIHSDETGIVQPNGILFPDSKVWIDRRQARCWRAPLRPAGLLSPDACRHRLETIIQLLAARRLEKGLLRLLSYVEEGKFEDGSISCFLSFVPSLENAVRDQRTVSIADCLEPFLGLGNGLTPSGDDFVLGFLLAQNRWGDVLSHSIDVIQLNQIILGKVYAITTILSANLIECSMQGQADERLLHALDSLLTGNLDTAIAANDLSTWGNSSGIDALVGMAFAFANYAKFVTHFA